MYGYKQSAKERKEIVSFIIAYLININNLWFWKTDEEDIEIKSSIQDCVFTTIYRY